MYLSACIGPHTWPFKAQTALYRERESCFRVSLPFTGLFGLYNRGFLSLYRAVWTLNGQVWGLVQALKNIQPRPSKLSKSESSQRGCGRLKHE